MTLAQPVMNAVRHVAEGHRRAIAQAYARQGLDAKRSQAWCEYGYAEHLTLDDYRKAWQRNAIAHGVTEKVLSKVWGTSPWLIEGDEYDEATPLTTWEGLVSNWAKRTNAWRMMEEADRMRMLGGYAYMLLRVADNKKMDQPVKRINNINAVVELVPVWADQIKPSRVNTNTQSPDYDKVEMWQYTEPSLHGAGSRTVDVHPDRVVTIGDPRYGIPFLRAGFNALVNLEKIEGGSGESFLKNSARQLHIDFDKDAKLRDIADAHGVPMSDLGDVYNEVVQEMNIGNDNALITQGATANLLTTTPADPQPSYNTNVQSSSAAFDVASKIIVGNQTGERASTEDLKSFNDRCQSDRMREVGPEVVRPIIDRLIELKALEQPADDYSVMWDDLTAPSKEDRMAMVKVMAETNQIMFMEGGLYTREQMLSEAGFEVEE